MKDIAKTAKKDKDPKDSKENDDTISLNELNNLLAEPKMRLTGIYGEINEEKCSEAVYGLKYLLNNGIIAKPEDPEDPDSDTILTYEPIQFYISTYGGSAADMFAVYDTIREIRDLCPVHTQGLGKVMSAGVLLLASGTKGERRIGKNCRVMIHGVISGQHGHIADVENEFEEAKLTQKMYIKALSEETNMTVKYLRNLVNKKTNIYLDAEEAVNLGIADIIV